ncbi:DUF998 domain-containing protein [Gordonia sp. PDNC005]|uniref:DUF998 domain-containing protein n=1 Tax=unclassified Gordonia (in: high G+C Gram-positive bacteria) TaxID=2657482 RepID=UPI00196368BB|nr:DUF998 domain-containing protein [Gordonia sp. PDNC005]QRY63324.1 DUF998 domain-containing protein [Gordonia sp. PDNC005]
MSTTLAATAVVAFTVRLIIFAALHVVGHSYNPVRHAVSDYAVGPTRGLSTAMTVVTAAGWAVLAAAVWTGLPEWSDTGQATALLLVLAAVFVVLPLVPTDLEGAAVTMIGRLHYVLAIAWFAISYSLTGNFSRWMSEAVGGGLASAASALHIVALVSLIVLVVALVTPLRSRLFGIAERVFIVSISVFYLLVAIGLVH